MIASVADFSFKTFKSPFFVGSEYISTSLVSHISILLGFTSSLGFKMVKNHYGMVALFCLDTIVYDTIFRRETPLRMRGSHPRRRGGT